jgi:hypothetical protein
MLQINLVGGLTGRYIDFTSAQHAELTMQLFESSKSMLARLRARPAATMMAAGECPTRV